MPSNETTTETLLLNQFVYDDKLVDSVIQRYDLWIASDQNSILKTLQCLNAIMKSMCPVFKDKKAKKRERKIHDVDRIGRVIPPDSHFIDFYDQFMQGGMPTSQWNPSSEIKEKSEVKVEDVDETFKSDFGNILSYETFK